MLRSTVLRRRLILAGIAALALWIAFFDSHSVLRRVQYARDLAQLREENQRLRDENAVLARQVEVGLSPEVVERVAREQYGMRRPGETVYRVADAPED